MKRIMNNIKIILQVFWKPILITVGIVGGLYLFEDNSLKFIDSFLTNGNDILQALLVLVTLLMGFVVNQFLSMLTNGSDRLLNIFLSADGTGRYLKSLHIYEMKIARFLLFSIALLINLLLLFKESQPSILKISLLSLLIVELGLTIDFYLIMAKLFRRNLDEYSNKKDNKNN